MLKRVVCLFSLVVFLGGCAMFGGTETEDQQPEPREMEEEKTRTEEKMETIKTENERLRDLLEKQMERVQQLQEKNRQIRRELEQTVDGGEVRQDGRNVVLNLQEKVLFAFGSVTVTEDGKSTLKQVASVLKNHPERPIRVEGHTDNLPIQTEQFPSNWELSAQRAINVLKYLVYGQGVGKERIAAVAYGQFQPLVPNDSQQNRAKNRRVEIVLHPKERTVKPLR